MARYWQLLPWEFRALDRDQQAELHALHDVEMELENYYHSESLRKMDNPPK